MSFHVAPLNPVSGTLSEVSPGVMSGVAVEVRPRGLAVQPGITGLQFGRNLSSPPYSPPLPAVRTVRFESSNRCPSSLKATWPLSFVARGSPRVNILIKHSAGSNLLVRVTQRRDIQILEYVSRPCVGNGNLFYNRNKKIIKTF